jgi:hypothetical protein
VLERAGDLVTVRAAGGSVSVRARSLPGDLLGAELAASLAASTLTPMA